MIENDPILEKEYLDSKKRERNALIAVIPITFLMSFMGSALNLSIPNIGEEFHTGTAMLGWVVNGFILTSAAFSIPFGRIADLKGLHKILIPGIIIFSITSLLSMFAWSMTSLIVLRLLQGVSAAMIASTNNAALISVFPPSKRGVALGYATATVYIGLSMGPVIGGFLNHLFGWRSIFFFCGLIGVFASVWIILKLDRSNMTTQKGKYDISGNLLYITMIVCALYGLSSLNTTSYGKYLLMSSAVFLILFILRQLKAESPIIQIRLFAHNIAYSLSNLAALMNYAATIAISYLLAIYLQTVMGFTSEIAGLIMISQPLMMAITSPFAGRMSDKIEPYKLATLGMGMVTIGLFSLIFLSDETPILYIVVTLLFIGIGFGTFSSPNANAIMSCVPKEDYGVANSTLATMRALGQGTGMAIVTIVVANHIGDIPIHEATTRMFIETMHTAFIIFTIICAVGTVISFTRSGAKKQHQR